MIRKQVVLDAREIRRAEKRAALVNDLLTKLSNAPDFYCEMKLVLALNTGYCANYLQYM